MAPPRRRPRQKTNQASSRVGKIESNAKWDSALKNAGQKRLLITLFYGSTGPAAFTSHQLRGLFAKVSTQPKYRRLLFAEVNADTMEEVAREAGIKKCPVVQAWWQGEPVDEWLCSATLQAPAQLKAFLERNIEDYLPTGSLFSKVVKIAAAAAFLAGGAFFATRLTSSDQSSGGSAGSEALAVKQRILAAQARLRALERANRGKQARAQRKLLETLNAQARALERREQKDKNTAAAGGAGADGTAAGEGTGGGGSLAAAAANSGASQSSRRGSHSRRTGSVPMDLNSISRLRRRRDRGDVLYSDEEDALVAAEGTVFN